MEIKIIQDKINLDEVKRLANESFDDMVKAEVDIEQEVMAIGGDLHADGEKLLLERGSKQEDIWGINIYPDKPREEWLEYTSLINIRPSQNNNSLGVEDLIIREKIKEIVNNLIV